MKIKIFTGIIAIFIMNLVFSQDLTVDQVLDNMKAKAEAIESAHFLLTGRLIDPDGSEIVLEVDVGLMPKVQTTRAEFFQPDALADNFIILDKDAVYNYVYLTNQATIFSADDPDALGGILPEREGHQNDGSFDFDLEKLFSGWNASLDGYEETGAGNVYKIRFDNKEEDVVINHVNVVVLDKEWIPISMEFVKADGSLMTELFFEDMEIDGGLSLDDLLYIPDDAEIIDER